MTIRTTATLSSDTHTVGEKFFGALDEPLRAEAWVVAAKGTIVEGIVVEADRGGRVRGRPWLSVQLTKVHSGGAGVIRMESNPVWREGGDGRLIMLRRGSPAVIPANTVLEFSLKGPVTVAERAGERRLEASR